MTEGKLRSGYEGRLCAAEDCRIPLTIETGAFLHKDRESDKFVIFCEDCSVRVELSMPLRCPRVNL